MHVTILLQNEINYDLIVLEISICATRYTSLPRRYLILLLRHISKLCKLSVLVHHRLYSAHIRGSGDMEKFTDRIPRKSGKNMNFS